jgi:CysZ protein
MKGIHLAFESYIEAFTIVSKAKLKKYYFFPGIISIVLLLLFYFIGDFFSFKLFDFIEKFFNLSKYGKLVYVLLKLTITVVAFLIYFLIYKALLLVFLSPVLSYVSEKTEFYINEKPYEIGFIKNLKLAWRGIVISSKGFIREMIGTLIITLLSFIFPINILVPLMLYLIQSYYTGFSFMDYTLERHDFNAEHSFKFLKENKLFAITSGGIFIILFLIPVLGFFMAPILAAVAITRGTLIIIENKQNQIEQ